LQTEDLSKEYTISLLTAGSYVIQKLTEPYQKVSYNGSNCVKEIPEIGSNFTIGEKRYMLITNYNSLSKLLSEHFNEKITSLITEFNRSSKSPLYLLPDNIKLKSILIILYPLKIS